MMSVARIELLGRSAAREEFGRFAATCADGLLRTAYLMAGDRGEAEDIVQECLLRVARKWSRVRAMEHPVAYARRVMVGLVLDGSRQRSRRSRELAGPLPVDGLAEPDDELDSVRARADLVRALAELPARQRAVLVLRYFSDLPEAEVADLVGCSVGTVKSSASRGLERLRDALDDPAAHRAAGRGPATARRTAR